jgi:predicted TIM-barrel fold metal-dependent hydrolase
MRTKRKAIAIINGPLDEEVRKAVCFGNAEKLLGLTALVASYA